MTDTVRRACDILDSPAGKWPCLAVLVVIAIVCIALDHRRSAS